MSKWILVGIVTFLMPTLAIAVDGEVLRSQGRYYCHVPHGGGHQSFNCSWGYVDCPGPGGGGDCSVNKLNDRTRLSADIVKGVRQVAPAETLDDEESVQQLKKAQ